ncbi:MAG: FkbM family methyltransferase [Alphaproteobacteria bacterium]|nr:FkbM family methyltransferase [Alphaproteobacteria bacterium]
MSATFFVPINNHYICDDLIDISNQKREPALYSWLNNLDKGSILFDIGTSYGQESSLASSLIEKNVTVFGFDCSLYQSHFCALNRRLNGNRFRFIFAAIGAKSGDLITIKANSDTHIPALHKKNVPYEYEVMSLALDDFAVSHNIQPTHLKIDVDGAEFEVLKGAKKILQSPALKEVFIEIDNENIAIIDFMASIGFKSEWQVEKEFNVDILFSKSA